MVADAAEAADELPRASMIAAPRLATVGMKSFSIQDWSLTTSAASATVDAARDWLLGSPKDDWVSMAVLSDGSYGVPEGLISSFPVTTKGGNWTIVSGLEIDDFSRGRIDKSTAELADEREAVTGLGLI
jgi:malate dehydrogenase